MNTMLIDYVVCTKIDGYSFEIELHCQLMYNGYRVVGVNWKEEFYEYNIYEYSIE